MNTEPERDRTAERIVALADEWAAAERHGASAVLDQLLAADFVGIGPRGFTLTKEQWLARHTAGDLKYQALDLADVGVRAYADAAIVTARETMRGTYQDHDIEGQFRDTLVLVRQDGHWWLASLQLSPIAPPPGGRRG